MFIVKLYAAVHVLNRDWRSVTNYYIVDTLCYSTKCHLCEYKILNWIDSFCVFYNIQIYISDITQSPSFYLCKF